MIQTNINIRLFSPRETPERSSRNLLNTAKIRTNCPKVPRLCNVAARPRHSPWALPAAVDVGHVTTMTSPTRGAPHVKRPQFQNAPRHHLVRINGDSASWTARYTVDVSKLLLQ